MDPDRRSILAAPGSQRPRQELGEEILRNAGGGGDRFAIYPANGTFNLSSPHFTDIRMEHKEEEEEDNEDEKKEKGAGRGSKQTG